MQHPGGTCVALPNVDACPQLSCAALTFMYLQQVSSFGRENMNFTPRACAVCQQLTGGSGVELERAACFRTRGEE